MIERHEVSDAQEDSGGEERHGRARNAVHAQRGLLWQREGQRERAHQRADTADYAVEHGAHAVLRGKYVRDSACDDSDDCPNE